MLNTETERTIYTNFDEYLADKTKVANDILHILEEQAKLADKLTVDDVLSIQFYYSVSKQHLQTSPFGKPNDIHFNIGLIDLSQTSEIEINFDDIAKAIVNHERLAEISDKLADAYIITFKQSLNQMVLSQETVDAIKHIYNSSSVDKFKYNQDYLNYFVTYLSHGMFDFSERFFHKHLITTLCKINLLVNPEGHNGFKSWMTISKKEFDQLLESQHRKLMEEKAKLEESFNYVFSGELPDFTTTLEIARGPLWIALLNEVCLMKNADIITDNEAAGYYQQLIQDGVDAYYCGKLSDVHFLSYVSTWDELNNNLDKFIIPEAKSEIKELVSQEFIDDIKVKFKLRQTKVELLTESFIKNF